MPMIVIDILGASANVEGMLARRLLEIRPGLFVGHVSRRAFLQLWENIKAGKPRSAILVHPCKNELGLGFFSLGNHHYQVGDFDGIELVSYQKQSVKTKSIPRANGG